MIDPTTITVATIWTDDERGTRVVNVRLSLVGGIIFMEGGPTGYESMRLIDYGGGDWIACLGAHARYDQCVVKESELMRAIAHWKGNE